mgnify:FL=1
MNKIKEIWGKNKVLIVLGLILLACLIAILIVTFSFFFGGGKSPDGDRAKDIDKYPISETIKNDYITSLESNESVLDVKFDIKDNKRTVYIIINFKEDTALSDAQAIVAASVPTLGENLLSYYDFEFLIKSNKSENSDGFIILGAKNVSGSGLVWNNNNPVESEDK